MLTNALRQIDLGTNETDFRRWSPFDRRRAWRRLLAYLFYPEDETVRKRYLAVISARNYEIARRVLRRRPRDTDAHAAAVFDKRAIAELGGLYVLSRAESLDTYERGLAARFHGKNRRALTARDIVIIADIFEELVKIWASGPTARGQGLNSAIKKARAKQRVPPNEREMHRSWGHGRSVAPLCAAICLAQAVLKLKMHRVLTERDLGVVLRIAVILEPILPKIIPHGRTGPVVSAENIWRIPSLRGLPKASSIPAALGATAL